MQDIRRKEAFLFEQKLREEHDKNKFANMKPMDRVKYDEIKKAIMYENTTYDEIELAIIKKHKEEQFNTMLGKAKGKKVEKNEAISYGYKSVTQTVRRRALVDQMLMDNKKADFTYATKKYRWCGEEGDFKSDDLVEYYRIYNQTQID